MNIFFKKELVSNSLRDRNGNVIPFEHCAGDEGVIVLADDNPAHAQLLEDLNKVAGTRGVIKINSQRYDEIKKKLPSPKRTAPLKGPRLFDPAAVNPFEQAVKAGILQQPATAVTAPASVAVAAEKSPAASVEAPVSSKPFKPRVGKVKTSKSTLP